MRKISLVIFTVFAVSVAFAQNFQGVIKYDYKVLGEGMGGMEAMMPTGMNLTIGKKGMIVEMQGGMMAAMMGTILSTKDGGYMIKNEEKTVYKLDPEKETEEKDAAPSSVVKEDEVIEILGYSCQKYKTTSTGGPMGETVTYVWATDGIVFPKFSQVKGAQSMAVEGVPGTALKTSTSVMGMTIVNTAIEISKEKPNKKLFKLPKGYEVKEFDPAMFGGMGG